MRNNHKYCSAVLSSTLVLLYQLKILSRWFQLFNDPHLKAVKMVKEVNYPSVGTIKVIDSAVKFEDYAQDWRPAPTLGQHTREVLKSELGYSDEEIDRLRNAEVIR